MRKFWKSLKFWLTDTFASRGKNVPVDDLAVGATELGWGSRAPKTTPPMEDLMVPASELGWGSRAPKTDREGSPDQAGEVSGDGVADGGDH